MPLIASQLHDSSGLRVIDQREQERQKSEVEETAVRYSDLLGYLVWVTSFRGEWCASI